ncbi:FAD-dependent oxidoreductase [Streptomyces sp. NPDC059017]|uniref:FAD-dependent oxidoreductase n=1 Tax=unclassified Streptomyces TaxID=2593676 RepID=UPI0036B33CC5
MSTIVVAGNGPAAHRLARQLRRRGHRGALTLVGAEPVPAYNRALLGSVLDGALRPRQLTLPALPDDVRVLTGTRITSVDRAHRVAHTDDGCRLPYDTLVLATGARPRIPEVPGVRTVSGALSEGVRTVRTAADCGPAVEGPVVVLGGGVLGVETALALRRAGHETALVHPSAHPMDDHLDATAGAMLTERLTSRGVLVHLGRSAVQYLPGKLLLDDGQVLGASTLLLCTGTTPDTELAASCGLAVREGVLVDGLLRTDDPFVHAIGDCASFPGAPHGSLTHAWEQADALARILTESPSTPYRPGGRSLRLRSPGTDVLVLGRPGDDADGTVPFDETVSFVDRAGGRYARLVLRGGRVGHGVLLGLSPAVAAVSRLYDGDVPLPPDRLALLLGRDDGYADEAEPPDHLVVCHCNNVTRKDLTDAFHQGAHDVAALAGATRATTGCGSCASVVRALCATLGRRADDRSRSGEESRVDDERQGSTPP